ncbi:putative quinol monooxygenase [Amphritea sp. 1_MG-2023]|uniref:putative quinol monooxygenase n=1 Tax=Amphritea sp. 1_MG-2023 TaxID=3062670 RepID=UPI0026E407E7|nr:putative quinol monooxygenase [Amphritea sp. 1_MG-2023]MDO6561787.1 putative quinol monooxygenase [Amphritea sp. 1_MG-2023]
MAFTQIIKFSIKPEFSEAFAAALSVNKKGVAQEPGNLEMRLYRDNANPNLFFAYDRWQDEAALATHMQQPYTKELLALAEQAQDKPIEVFTVNDTQPAPIALKQANPEDPLFNIFFIFKIKPGSREKLIQQFEKHITHTRTEDGCLLFDLYTVEGDDETLVVYEHWRKESDVWDIHFKQPYAMETGALMEECVIGELEQYMNFVSLL